MRVVLDTCVVVSALIGAGGPARRVLRRCLDGSLEPQVGPTLFTEYEAVTGRASIRALCRLSPAEINAVLDALFARARWVEPYFLWRPNLPDEGDNHVLELAIASQARWLITENVRDFGRGELRFPGLSVVRPHEMLVEVDR